MTEVKENAKMVANYLVEEGIQLPQKFREKFIKSMQRFYGEERGIPKVAIKAVLKICKVWKPYLADENEFHELVCKEVYSMACIHCAVISSSRKLKAYIGNVCKIKDGVVIPDNLSTVATFEGNATLETANLKKTL